MRKALLLIGILIVGLLLVEGCGKKETAPAKSGTLTVNGDASEVDALDEELDTSELDTLDSELDDLNW